MIGGSKRDEMSGNGEHRLWINFLVLILSQDIIRLIKSGRMRMAESAPRRREERMHAGKRYLL